MVEKEMKVVIVKNGPYLVSGGLPLEKEISICGSENQPEKWEKGKKYQKQENYALCRCGKSKNKPFCDGSHVAAKFNGTETASVLKFLEQAEKTKGNGISLLDASDFCSAARFCHLAGGTWDNVEKSKDSACKKMAIQTACNCPSGRLIIVDEKTGKPFENKFKPSIGLIEDPQAGVSGGIWLKGGIKLESDGGRKYEIRNRATLCRCGKSKNKPFCDGSHMDVKFNDGDESLK